MTKQVTVENVDDNVVETKITKSEAIDLLIGEMANELDDKIKAAEEEADAAEKTVNAFGWKGLGHFFTGAEIEINYYDYKKEKLGLSVEITLPMTDRRIPVALRSAFANKEKVKKDAREIQARKERLYSERQRIKNEMLRTILEGTQAGRKFLGQLGQLGELRVKIDRRRLLGDAK